MDPSLNSQSLFIEVSPMVEYYEPNRYPAARPPVPPKEEVMVKEEEATEENTERKNNLQELLPQSASEEEKDDVTHIGVRLQCEECAYTTQVKERLLRHVRKVHLGQNPFQCFMCDYSTYNKVLFEEHVRIHRGIKPFKCSYCDYCSASKKNTKKHELIHRPDNPLKCPDCPFIARHQRALVCHTKTHTASDEEDTEQKKRYKCEACGLLLKRKAFASHRSRRRQCPDCDIMMCSMAAFRMHMSDAHHKTVSDKSKVFQCAACAFCVNSKGRMLLHLIHHPQPVDEAALDVSVLRKYGIMQ